MNLEERRLGEAWSEWYENRSGYEPDADEPKRTYLAFSLFSLMLLIAGLLILLFLTAPRLTLLHPKVLLVVDSLVKLFCIVLALGFVCESTIVFFGKGFPLLFWKKSILETLAPLAIRLGERFGKSKDRMLNSFLKVHNSLVPRFKYPLIRLMLLFPRCLQNSNCDKKVVEDIANCKRCGECVICRISEMKERIGCEVFVASGGRQAREIIARNRPHAIIAVACERELVLGLQQLDSIPVVAIANKRPHGPCLNTDIDFKKIESVVDLLYGISKIPYNPRMYEGNGFPSVFGGSQKGDESPF